MISKTRKNHLIPLDYEEKRFATNNELLIDKQTQDLYAIDNNGKLISFYDEYLSKLEKDEVITKHTIYGIKINMNNPDSEGSVVYTNDSKKFTPLSVDLSTGECDYGSWKDIITEFFGVRPCIFSNVVEAYLDPNDYTKTIDGEDASNYNGNVMIEFKKRYYKFYVEGDSLCFKVSDGKVDDTYIQDAFLIDSDGVDTINDYMYISAYAASKDDQGKIRSVSGVEPYIPFTELSDLLTEIEVEDRYTVLGYTKYLYILGLSWLVSRSLDSSIFGNGQDIFTSGVLDNKGLFYGVYNGPNKIFGIENLFIGLPLLCAGITSNSGNIYMAKHGPYSTIQKNLTGITLDVPEGEYLTGYPIKYVADSNIIFPKNISLEDAASIDHFQGMCIYINDNIDRYLTIQNSGSAFQFFDCEDNLILIAIRFTFC